jgi:hypothetical protein
VSKKPSRGRRQQQRPGVPRTTIPIELEAQTSSSLRATASPGAISMQSACAQKSIRMKYATNQTSIRLQSDFNQTSIRLQSDFNQTSISMPSECNQHASTCVHRHHQDLEHSWRGHSSRAVRLASKSSPNSCVHEELISGHQRSSAVIRGLQRSSSPNSCVNEELISGL